MNKKGFIRTLEAIVAIVLIFSFIYFVLPKKAPAFGDVPDSVRVAEDFIVREILYNSDFRDLIFSTSDVGQCRADIDEFVREAVPYGYNYACETCSGAQTCIGADAVPFDRDVYANSVYLIRDQPKVLRVYMWTLE